MAYPGRGYPQTLPQFRGTGTVHQTPAQRQVFIQFVAAEYQAGRSLREVAALTDRTQMAVRRALTEADVPLRRPGAPRIRRAKGTGSLA
ncbi:helix-turn-helix domain-containing protein [Ornithinimicrobium murale]|uniref:helix-turn-helix domain-containing protein n=1 Tax=Ornithinimicrobium murale TaxID=1050153 RepID=UPI000E0CFFE7